MSWDFAQLQSLPYTEHMPNNTAVNIFGIIYFLKK